MLPVRKFLSATGLLTIISSKFKQIKPPIECLSGKNIAFSDCLMSAFAVFSQKYPSLLQFDNDHRLDPQVAHNLKTLYGIDQIPCDTYMRERLDEGDPSTLRKTYKSIFAFLQRGKALESYRYLGGRYLLAGDGTGFFKSKKVHCDQCCVMSQHKTRIKICTDLPAESSLVKRHSYALINPVSTYFQLYHLNADGKYIDVPLSMVPGLNEILCSKKKKNELTKNDKEAVKNVINAYHQGTLCDNEPTYYHNMYCAAIIHPDQRVVIPFVPEPIMKEDGSTKNDCERNASQRLYRDLKREHPHLKVIVVEDSLSSNYPHLSELKRLDMQFISGVKQGDHEFLFKWGNEHECDHFEHVTNDGTNHRYRYLNDVPLNKTHSDFKINFLEYWETDKKGKTQHFCWVTDITITKDNIYDIMRGGRSNWKIENHVFNTLTNQNYHFRHNFGHGYKNLSTMLAMLMMLAFFVDQVQELCCRTFQLALKIRKSRVNLWTKIKGLFMHYFINNWDDLFHTIIHGPPRTFLSSSSL